MQQHGQNPENSVSCIYRPGVLLTSERTTVALDESVHTTIVFPAPSKNDRSVTTLISEKKSGVNITRLSLSYCILVVKTGKNSRSVTSIKKCIRIFFNYFLILSLLYSYKFFLSRTVRKRLFFGPKPLKSGKISPTVSYIRK
uniref:Uncharacterized protein n=1 Tax=Cacopsylla melanoneura TaxID=428564 RepID=A0A8D8XKD7_9HEMI